MTTAQRTRFYFPAWHAAALRHNWCMVSGRLQARAPGQWGCADTTQLIQDVWCAAEAIARAGHRAMTDRDLRHGCHVVALGQDRETHRLQTREVDRVVHCFRLLADPDNIDAFMKYFEPANAERRLILWRLENKWKPAHVQRICSDIYATSDFYSLTTECLSDLERLLRTRPHSVAAGGAVPIPDLPVDEESFEMAMPPDVCEPF